MRRSEFAMRRLVTTIALAIVGLGAVVAPASTARSADVDPANFVRRIDNPWYPLRPGTTYVFTGASDGKPTRDVVTVTRQSKTILGVHCVVVTDNAYEAGKLSEATHDWFAQDKRGTVWYFGEATSTVSLVATSSMLLPRKRRSTQDVRTAFMSIAKGFTTYSEGMTLAGTNAQLGDPGACRRR